MFCFFILLACFFFCEVLDEIVLRRTKESRKKDLKLAPLRIKVEKLELNNVERDFYESIYKNCKVS